MMDTVMVCLQLLLGFLVAVVIFVTVLKLACRLCILFKNHILQLLCCGAVIAIIFLFRESIEENLRACLVWPPLEPYLSLFDSVSHFVLITVIGGFFVWLGCKVCMAVGAIWRLWLHRRIARMSYTFAVIFCCVVIVSPIVISVPLLRAMEQCGTVFVERNNLSENLPDKTETASNEAVDNAENKQTPAQGVANLVHHAVSGYFYAIQQGEGEKMLRLGEKSIGLIFGLVGYLIFSGFTVSLFVNMVSKKQERIALGEEQYSNLHNHYVVIGSGVFLETIIGGINSDKSDIVILSSESIIELRKRLSARLQESVMARLVFVHGTRTNEEDLRNLCFASCKMVYLIGDYSEPDQDDRNLASLTMIDEILGRDKGNDSARKLCKIFFERYHTFTLFQGLIKNSKLTRLILEPVCFYKHWAEIVLGIRPRTKHGKQDIIYDPFEGTTGIKPSDEKSFVHLVIIGMSRMGMALATEAALHLHFPNSSKKRTRITMVDVHAYREMCEFQNLHQNVFEHAHYTYTEFDEFCVNAENCKTRELCNDNSWLDTEFHFIQGNAESKVMRDVLVRYSREEGVKLVIAVCLPDDRHALSLAMALPNEFLRKDAACILGCGMNISHSLPLVLVQQQCGAGLLELLNQQVTNEQQPRDEQKKLWNNVKPFGMLDEAVGTDAECDRLAVYLDLTYNTEEWKEESLMETFQCKKKVDEARGAWKNAEEWKRISNRYAMASRDVKLRSFGYDLSIPECCFSAQKRIDLEVMAEMEHNRWCMEKLMVGYRALSEEQRIMLDNFDKTSKVKRADGKWEKSKWEVKADELKNEAFIHPAIRPWNEIVDTDYQKFYYTPTINTCIGICLVPEMEKIIK